jgi:hypothetical protein
LQPGAPARPRAQTSPPPFSPPRAGTAPPRTAPPPSSVSTPPPALAPVAVEPLSAPVPGTPAAATETRADDGRARRIAGIGLIAGGVVAIGGGVAATVVGKNKFDAIEADAAADRPYNESNGNWKGYETAAAVMYVVGGAAVVGGVVLYVAGRRGTEERRPPAASSVALRPVLTPGRAGATLSVRF